MTKRTSVFLTVIGLVVLAMLVRWTTLGRRAEDMALLECTNLYHRATTAQDTILVDETRPTQQPRGTVGRITCGDLRR